MKKIRILSLDILSALTINIIYILFLLIAIDSTIKEFGKEGTLVVGGILPFVVFFQIVICIIWELLISLFSKMHPGKKKVIAFIISNILVPAILVLDLGGILMSPYVLILVFISCVILYKRILKKQGFDFK